MPINYILKVEVFNIWGIDFVRGLPSPHGNKYIFATIDYVFE